MYLLFIKLAKKRMPHTNRKLLMLKDRFWTVKDENTTIINFMVYKTWGMRNISNERQCHLWETVRITKELSWKQEKCNGKHFNFVFVTQRYEYLFPFTTERHRRESSEPIKDSLQANTSTRRQARENVSDKLGFHFWLDEKVARTFLLSQSFGEIAQDQSSCELLLTLKWKPC